MRVKGLTGQQQKLIGAGAILLGLLALQRLSCGAGVENGGIKPPKQLSRQEREQDANSRIQAIQNNPNMPPQAKEMVIQMIKRQEQSTAAASAH